MATVTKPVALNESLNTTDSTPKNIADVLKDKLGDIANAISGGGGGSGGHTIQNASGANMPQEPTMQFADSHVSDDSTNEKTEIEVIKSVASADYSLETEDGLYLIPDGDGSVIEPASEDYVEVTTDNVKTRSQLLNELFGLADLSKITSNSIVDVSNGSEVYYLVSKTSSALRYFNSSSMNASQSTIARMSLMSSGSEWFRCVSNNGSTNSITNISSDVPSAGVKYTLYYGQKKAVVDLQTTANRCWYDSNTTVKQKIDAKADKNDLIIATVNSANKIATFPVDTTGLYYVEIGVGSQNTSTAIIAISKMYSNICPYVLAEKYASDCQISSISMSGNNVVLTMSTQYFYNVYAKQITKLE